jgi:NAD(P)H dehydrogenase (quinone)
MNVLIVYAHPERRSLNGMLNDFAVERLRANGHTVQVSDLYAMNWKATLDVRDVRERAADTPFHASLDSKHAFENGLQSRDIEIEQDKMRWADALILQFPMWWFSMPAIMKGWVERVYAYGFGYGVGEHSASHWGDRYGEGMMKGKRAMIVTTTGGWESHYAPRGINGPIDDVLFHIQHGMLFYPGFDVLPPYVLYQTSRMDEARVQQIRESFGQRLDSLWDTTPIAYRRQNAGDYLIPALTLRDDLSEGESGFASHISASPA